VLAAAIALGAGSASCWSQGATQAVPASSVAADPQAAAADAERANTLFLNRRPIVGFRATFLGRTPAHRAALAAVALQSALQRGGPGKVTVWIDGDTAGLQVDGSIVFYLVPGDVDGATGAALASAADAVRLRLQAATLEVREMSDLRRIGEGVGYSLAATALALVLIRLAWWLRRRTVGWLHGALDRWQAAHAGQGLVLTSAHYARSISRALATVVAWGTVLLLFDLWFTFVLGQFAYTRPWAERSTEWLLGMLAQFASAAAGAVPGLLTAGVIFVLARLVSRAGTALMQRVERGDVSFGWLDADTAGPTRRVGNFVIWLFALAIAYPFLPGANSEAFKGVSVLAGLMLSLGASSVVGQVIAGLSLMYSRTLRAGEYVKIGETEGTVTAVGMFATKIQTGLGEEVSLPNALVFGQAVRNFSRLVPDGQFVLHTAVTIGYATPWRQVHAMLLEAARRVPGVAQEPVPYVIQTALSDFYVEYRLCAHSSRSAPRRRAEVMNQLHGQIQDVFNENGVQIMSPHYRSDPPEPQVVPPEGWSPGLARTQHEAPVVTPRPPPADSPRPAR
jgi:small-conductance mechanosensitive channel